MYLNIEAAVAAYIAYVVGWPILSIMFSGKEQRWDRDKRPYSVRLAEWKQSNHRRPS